MEEEGEFDINIDRNKFFIVLIIVGVIFMAHGIYQIGYKIGSERMAEAYEDKISKKCICQEKYISFEYIDLNKTKENKKKIN